MADVDEIVPGTEWDRVSKLCDFNAKTRCQCIKLFSAIPTKGQNDLPSLVYCYQVRPEAVFLVMCDPFMNKL